MLSWLIGLIIMSQLAAPNSGAVLGESIVVDKYPKREQTGSFEPIINSASAMALDMRTGKILFQKNGFQKRSIASITKLMTALVFLESEPDLNRSGKITENDKINGGKIVFETGEELKLIDMLKSALVGSVNSAADGLARNSEMTYGEFIDRMNEKARELGMKDSQFFEATGIDARNQATAMDAAILLREALYNPLIKETLTLAKYSLTAVRGNKYTIKNTNQLLKSYLDIVGGKTGYIEEAGYCLANLVRAPEAPEGIVVVILGASSEAERFQENKFLSQWVFDNWQWREEE